MFDILLLTFTSHEVFVNSALLTDNKNEESSTYPFFPFISSSISSYCSDFTYTKKCRNLGN